MYQVDIDFDDASKEWRKNKVETGNGTFRYRCAHLSIKKQQFCKNPLFSKSPYCRFHLKNGLKK